MVDLASPKTFLSFARVAEVHSMKASICLSVSVATVLVTTIAVIKYHGHRTYKSKYLVGFIFP